MLRNSVQWPTCCTEAHSAHDENHWPVCCSLMEEEFMEKDKEHMMRIIGLFAAAERRKNSRGGQLSKCLEMRLF